MKTIRECLMKQTLAALQEQLFMLGRDVPEDDKRRKAELCAEIERVIETDRPAVRRWLGADAVKALRRFFARRGETALTLSGDQDAAVLLDPLRRLGLAWMEERRWVIRGEARALAYPLAREELAALEQEEALVNAASGILCVLGMAPLEELNRMARGVAEIADGPAAQLEEALNAYYGFRAMAEFEGVKWACHWALDNEEALWERLQAPFLAALPYPECDWASMEWVGGLPAWESGDALHTALFSELTARGCPEEEAGVTIAQAMQLFQNDRGDEAMAMLLKAGKAETKEELAALTQRMTALLNRLPQWMNKGYSAEALMAMRRPRKVLPKVGRNEPCPCGSGRKYKNCCGRFQ